MNDDVINMSSATKWIHRDSEHVHVEPEHIQIK